MKTFRFNHYGKAGPDELFYITTPAESDTYVLLTEADAEIAALRERQRVLVNSLDRVTAYYEGCLNGVTTDNYQDVLDEARAALAAKEG